MDICLSEFAKWVPHWYEKYKEDKEPHRCNGLSDSPSDETRHRFCGYYPGYCDLMSRLHLKANHLSHLELEDLCEIADWGGNVPDVKGRLIQNNHYSDIVDKTSDAVRYFTKPKFAFGAVSDLEQ